MCAINEPPFSLSDGLCQTSLATFEEDGGTASQGSFPGLEPDGHGFDVCAGD